jgi:hypothetical protein
VELNPTIVRNTGVLAVLDHGRNQLWLRLPVVPLCLFKSRPPRPGREPTAAWRTNLFIIRCDWFLMKERPSSMFTYTFQSDLTKISDCDLFGQLRRLLNRSHAIFDF